MIICLVLSLVAMIVASVELSKIENLNCSLIVTSFESHYIDYNGGTSNPYNIVSNLYSNTSSQMKDL